MTLEQLRIFVAVAHRLHMTRAAEELHITQSAASAAIATLENRHNVRLFDRVGRGIDLTVAGRIFLSEAIAVLDRADRAVLALDDLTGLKRGALVIGASQTLAHYWLPQQMAQFAEAYPGITLRMVSGNTAQIAECVNEGRIDFGFVEGHVEDPVLEHCTVGSDRISLYVTPDHPLVHKQIGRAELVSARWVLRERGSGTRSEFEQLMRANRIDLATLNIVLELPTNEAVLAATAHGELVTVASDTAALAYVSARLLAALDFDCGTRKFELLRHRERQLSSAAQAFIARLPLARGAERPPHQGAIS